MPNGAKSHTARNPIGRDGARSEERTAARGARQDCPAATPDALSPSALAFAALRDFAPFGISRRLGFRAVWAFATYGMSRRIAFRALPHFAPSGLSSA